MNTATRLNWGGTYNREPVLRQRRARHVVEIGLRICIVLAFQQ